MKNNSIFPQIPNEIALGIHACISDEINPNYVNRNESIEAEEELFLCPECKEWTSDEDSCCGVGPSNQEYEKDYER